jgi:acyl carrier protein
MHDRVIKILLDIKPELAPVLGDHLNLVEVLDSMDIIFLVEAIERDCDLIIDGMDILPENFASLQKIVELITRKQP